MHIGLLDKIIQIQRQTLERDTYGQQFETWINLTTVYANIKPLVGKEYLTAQQISTELTHDVTIRYRRDVLPKMRIKYNNRLFEIHSAIDSDERREWLFLKCREVVL